MLKTYCLIFLVCSFHLELFSQKPLAQYVNPFIGTGGHGHTYPGATLPHGMVQLSPDTRLEGWDGCGGYHYSDSFIYGFSHTHLSGTGVSDFGDILLMPMNGKMSPDNKVYGSKFSHKHERASAGFYSVILDDDNIETEFTASERVGFHHYRFSSPRENNIILDLKHRDEVIESSVKIEDSVTVTGLRRSKAWADNQYVFFVIKFSKPIINSGMWDRDVLVDGSLKQFGNSRNLKAFFNFDLSASKDILIKVAISAVSVDGAKRNMDAEIPDWDFEAVKKNGEQKWNTELSKIEVASSDEEKLKIFYTALYHTAIVPNINMDIDGKYRGRDNQIHTAEGFTYYSVFSLWDTYRAAHPLYTIIDRQRSLDYIKTFLKQYEQGGRLPVWELASCETDCMIGYHSVPVIYDAYTKGINAFDTMLALEAMKKGANREVLGLPSFISKGLIETEDEAENVSKTLEYAYDDWCIAMFAKDLGNSNDYLQYIKRAQYYKNILDVKTGFMRPRKNGDWLSPFDPREVNNNYTEANSWQYSFYMPQDIEGYLSMIGGKKKLEDKLDSLFTAPTQTTGRDQSDITGLIGQYAHGNEPSHHIIYLYNYTARPDKAQTLLQEVMTKMYKNEPDGLIGNEDCGQMSAWYVLSSLGFYPVTPGTTEYMLGTPQFPTAKIHLENGKTFTINSPGISDNSFYVQEALLTTPSSPHQSRLNNQCLKHIDIADGGTMIFQMGDKPGRNYKTDNGKLKGIFVTEEIVINPVIHGGPVPFRKSKQVSISSSQRNVNIYYTTDNTDPDQSAKKYLKPILVDKSLILKAIAIDKKGKKSFVTTAHYKQLPHDWTVKLNAPYEQQYGAGGEDGLVDQIRGTTNWHKGNWQGYQKNNMDVELDLKSIQQITSVTIGFLQDTKAWIVLPKELTVALSSDGKNYTEVYRGSDFLKVEDLAIQIKNIQAGFPATKARYIKIKAIQFGNLPSWHEGAGGDTHIFVDEIEVN